MSRIRNAKLTRLLVIAPMVLAVLAVSMLGVRRLVRKKPPPQPPTERALVKAAMRARPGDPWPRGAGHVLLAFPGTREDQKGYHEPGGSFSPAAGSFGVSIWSVADSAGEAGATGGVATSDSLPLSEIAQRLEPNSSGDPHRPPAIVDDTSAFRARWEATAPGKFTLAISAAARGPVGRHLVLVVRSVGPAGGPIRALEYRAGRLRINDRWTVALSPAPSNVKLGEEPSSPASAFTKVAPWWQISATPSAGSTADATMANAWRGASGWGFALLAWDGAPAATVLATLVDGYPVPESPLADLEMGTPLEATLPEARFVPSLHAQVAHLLMSLVGREPRPGDPINYPLPWLRDGAHVIVALARAGRSDVARRLVQDFAEHDFFGGFGPEADGPGLALWAIDEVSAAERDLAFDRWLYPHVHRKADEIIEMLEADRELHHEPVAGPIVPSWRTSGRSLSLVCDAAEDGLIVGRMDGHRPVLYVNAVSYLGLVRASAFAARMGDGAAATLYAARAVTLREAWLRANHPPQSDNDRTYISALWPTWVGSSQRAVVRRNLEQRWSKNRTADGGFNALREWTYFDVAEAHQWLALGEPARAATTLRYYWDHQVSPGLFVWSEGSGEENSFGLWENIRGWVDPAHVTPHYWTAAEMLLLELDMLAYVDDSDAKPVWVIGAGVERAWLDGALSASNVRTRLGRIDWSWRDGQLDVTIHGHPAELRLGSSFDPKTPVHVQFIEPPPAAIAGKVPPA